MELDRFDWLAQRIEAPVDPDQRIVDPHHHLWDRGGSTYLAPELLADLTSSHNVVKSVFVECMANYDRSAERHMASVGETVFVAGEADATDAAGGPTIAGIVSRADMMLGDAVEEVLAAHDAGPDRCMFESNFPVDRQSLPYPVLWNALQIVAADYDQSEKDRLFAGTAEAVYRLE